MIPAELLYIIIEWFQLLRQHKFKSHLLLVGKRDYRPQTQMISTKPRAEITSIKLNLILSMLDESFLPMKFVAKKWYNFCLNFIIPFEYNSDKSSQPNNGLDSNYDLGKDGAGGAPLVNRFFAVGKSFSGVLCLVCVGGARSARNL
jgi:hypothetical protein